MAGNFEQEILDALRGVEETSPRVLGGYPHKFDPAGEDDPLMRALSAAIALKSGQENEQLPDNAPRVTDPLDRANYPGS